MPPVIRSAYMNREKTAKIFKSPILEALTKTHWSIPLFIFLPFIGYLVWISIHSTLSVPITFGLMAIGVFFWTFAEYFLHRFVFHFEPKSKIGKNIHFFIHGIHHDYPQDAKRLVIPPFASALTAVLFYFGFEAVLGTLYTPPFFAGFVAGYLYYDLLHYTLHHATIRGKWLKALKHQHMQHHFNNPQSTYGVSTQIWDRLFGSLSDRPHE